MLWSWERDGGSGEGETSAFEFVSRLDGLSEHVCCDVLRNELKVKTKEDLGLH